MNIRAIAVYPKVTLITQEVFTDPNDPNTVLDCRLVADTSIESIPDVIRDSGEDSIIGDFGFFTVSVFCNRRSGQEALLARSMVMMSLNMQAFHALNFTDIGNCHISYLKKG